MLSDDLSKKKMLSDVAQALCAFRNASIGLNKEMDA
jgi:hypothetical protein